MTPYKAYVQRRRKQGLCRCGKELARKGSRKLSRCRACLDKASACTMKRKETLERKNTPEDIGW